ncbi:unnamed protein product [Cochlearia groenlandica]
MGSSLEAKGSLGEAGRRQRGRNGDPAVIKPPDHAAEEKETRQARGEIPSGLQTAGSNRWKQPRHPEYEDLQRS